MRRLSWCVMSALAGTISCNGGESTGLRAAGNDTEVSLDFCAYQKTPVFFAYRNEGASWVRVAPNASGSFTFLSSARLTIAYVVSPAYNVFATRVIQAAASELAKASGATCIETTGTSTLIGQARNFPQFSGVQTTIGAETRLNLWPDDGVTFDRLPAGPLDIISHRLLAANTASPLPDRVIVRRNVPNAGAVFIDPLDFASTEAVAFKVNTATASGVDAADVSRLLLRFSTAGTRGHTLVSYQAVAAPLALYHLPAAQTVTGDLTELDVVSQTASGAAYRAETQFYRLPSDRTIALGSAAADPSVTTEATSPSLRFRVQQTSQQEYGDIFHARFTQGAVDAGLTITAAYLGRTPATWDVTMPDLSGVVGYPPGAALASGSQTWWSTTVYAGPFSALLGFAVDGDILRCAGRGTDSQSRQENPFLSMCTSSVFRAALSPLP